MKKIFTIIALFAAVFARAQQPVVDPVPHKFLKWISVKDSARIGIVFIGQNDTAATQAYVRSFLAGGLSLVGGYGIKIVGDTVLIDSSNYRKQDSMYVISDSVFAIKINGNVTTYKMRGAVFSFNGRAGAVMPANGDYRSYYAQLDSAYNNPPWINTLSWSKINGTPNSLAGYGVIDGVKNIGGGSGYGSGTYSSRPVTAVFGYLYYASDSTAFYWYNGSLWTKLSLGSGSSIDMAGLSQGNIPFLRDANKFASSYISQDTANQLVKFSKSLSITATSASKLDVGNTAQRPASPVVGHIRYNTDSAGYEQFNGVWAKFAVGGGGGIGTVTQINLGRGLQGTNPLTSSGNINVDTLMIPRFADTASILVTYTGMNTQGFLKTETDPIANAKNITINTPANGGIIRTGSAAQTVGSGPVYSLIVDSGVYVTQTMLGRKAVAGGTAGRLTYLTTNGTLYTTPIINDTAAGQIQVNTRIQVNSSAAAPFQVIANTGNTSGVSMSGAVSGLYVANNISVTAPGGLTSQMVNNSLGAGGYIGVYEAVTAAQPITHTLIQTGIDNAYIFGLRSDNGTSNRFTFGRSTRASSNQTWSNVLNVLQYDSLGRIYINQSPRNGVITDSVLMYSTGGEIKKIGKSSIPLVHSSGISSVYSSANGDTLYDPGWKASADIWMRKNTDSTNYAILRANGVTPGSYISSNITIDSTGRITSASNGSGGGGTYNFLGSLSNDGSGNITFDNDNDAPGNNYFYMTNASGTKGWFPLSGLPAQIHFSHAPGFTAGDRSTIYASLSRDSIYDRYLSIASGGGVLVDTSGHVQARNSYSLKFDTGYAPFQNWVLTHSSGSSDSLKHKFVDTSSVGNNLFLGYDRTAFKWKLYTPFTSVAAGLGMTGGTITGTGTLGVDTSYVMTKSSAQQVTSLKDFRGGVSVNNLTSPGGTIVPKLVALVEDSTNGTVYKQGYQSIDTTGIVDGAFVQWDASGAHFKVQSNTGFGTVTQVTTGNLAPLFTATFNTNTTTPAQVFTLSNTPSNDMIFGKVGASGAPVYFNPSLTSSLFANEGSTVTVYHGNASGNGSFGPVNLNTDVTGTLMAAQFPSLTGGDVTTVAGSLAAVIGAGKVTNTMLAGSIDLANKVTGILPATNGGTGVNNSGKLITLGGSLTTSGAFASTFTMTGATSVTFPTSGMLLTSTGSGAGLSGIPLSVTGTANQVLVNGTAGAAQTGALTLSLPQSLSPGSSPLFTALQLTGIGTNLNFSEGLLGITAAGVVYRTNPQYTQGTGFGNAYTPVVTTGSGTLSLPDNLWFIRTGGTVTCESSVTLNISGASPTFAIDVPLTGFTAPAQLDKGGGWANYIDGSAVTNGIVRIVTNGTSPVARITIANNLGATGTIRIHFGFTYWTY